jgi:hypothetical protein
MQRRILRWISLFITVFCAMTIAAKKPTAVRLGVVSIQDHAGRSLGYSALDGRLLGLLRSAGFHAVPLRFQPAADLESAARQADCLYILYTDILDIHRTAGPPIGKAVRGIGGTLAGNEHSRKKDIWEAAVEFRLFAVGQVLPVLSTSVTGRNGKSGSPKNPDATGSAATPAPAGSATTSAVTNGSAGTAAVSAAEPNILLEATPAEETGRQRKHKSVAVAAALEREVKLVREKVNQPPASAENQ